MLHHRLLAALLVALLLCQAAAPTMAVAASQGLQGGWAIGDAGDIDFPHSLQRQLDDIEEAGAGWVRINFRLGEAYDDWTTSRNGRTALEQYDEVVDTARARGLKVLGQLSNESWKGSQQKWTQNNAENLKGRGNNRYLQKFARDAAVVLAAHFDGRIRHREVWNEPNAYTSSPYPGVYSGASFIYPSNFAWLLRHVYRSARKAGLDDVTFVSGGIFSHDLDGAVMPAGPRGAGTIRKRGDYRDPSREVGVRSSGGDYLTATYRAGKRVAGWDKIKGRYGSYPLDAIGQHLYVDQGGSTSASRLRTHLDDLRASYAEFEGSGTDKETIITEFGWSTWNVSESTQANNLRVAHTEFEATPYVRNAYWFSIQDIDYAGLFYGLRTSGGEYDGYDGERKSAFRAYQEVAGD